MLRVGLIVSSFMVAVAPLGCVSEGPPLPPRPEPRSIAQPQGMEATTLVLTADQVPADSDGNGYADTFRVIIYLFGDRRRHELPIHVDGSFVFELSNSEGDLLARWALDEEAARQGRFEAMVGPGYGFTLNILDVGSDRISDRLANLRCVFLPRSGDPIEVRGAATIRVGLLGSRPRTSSR